MPPITVFSHLSRLQKDTFHLKEVILSPVWDNALNCLAREGKFLEQPHYTFWKSEVETDSAVT